MARATRLGQAGAVSTPRVAVVGAGISGVACARALTAGGAEVVVLDRGHVPGGRMASRTLDGRRVDLGASYLTVSDDDFRAVVDDWTARGLAREWTRELAVLEDGGRATKSGPLRYGAAGGLRSLVEDLATGLDVRGDTQVQAVGGGPGGGTVDGEAYDAVVLAVPDPQALPLVDPALTGVTDLLRGREWEPVLALAARFPEATWGFDGAFVNGDDVLSWVADDGSRRGDGAPVLVAHSTGAFAAPRLADPAAAAPELLGALERLLGLSGGEVLRVQRWSLAKPAGSRDEPYGLVGRIGLCGDGWGRSKVETAWLSGHRLGQALAAQLG